MDKIYIIYEIHTKPAIDFDVWDRGYLFFTSAIDVVMERVNKINENFKKTESYRVGDKLPGKMEEYQMNDLQKGMLVANLWDYDIEVFIKEVGC